LGPIALPLRLNFLMIVKTHAISPIL